MNLRPVARNKDLVVQKLNEEIVVYDLNTNHALYLNETSAKIWKLCDGERSVEDIRKRLKKDFNTAVSDDFILFALYQLRQDKLLTSDREIDRKLKKFSGRRVIKRIGLGTLIKMPKISSVLAPTAIVASCLTVPPMHGAQQTV